jgi:hypothetical protein
MTVEERSMMSSYLRGQNPLKTSSSNIELYVSVLVSNDSMQDELYNSLSLLSALTITILLNLVQ